MSQQPPPPTSIPIALQPARRSLPQRPWHTVDLLERGPHLDFKRRIDVEADYLAQALDPAASLRVVIAPSDDEDQWTTDSLERLYEFFEVPDGFALERMQSVSHSFGSRTANNEFCSWFHFLCRYIPVSTTPGMVGAPRYWKAGFFVRKSDSLGVTLVCFASPDIVLERLEQFVDSPSWFTACETPYLLFDVILGALFLEVDETVWAMGGIFGGLEREITDHVDGANKSRKQQYYKPPFGTLHRYANDLSYLKETVESNLLIAEAILERCGRGISQGPTQASQPPTGDDVLRERVLYHRSLFRSTQLRLASLDRRMQNASNLAFNLVTQQDSLIMMQDSASMTTLSVVAAAFLPITTIATIIGSQLFVADQDDQGNWIIATTPLIRYLYISGIPITIAVFIAPYFWSSRRRMAWPTGYVSRKETIH